MTLESYLQEASSLIQKTITTDLSSNVLEAVNLITATVAARRPLLICGNGGSAADACHIAGELVGRFLLERPAMNVLALPANQSVLTAWSNDYDYSTVFARQVEAHGGPGAVVWGISTSGNSHNVVAAFERAHQLDMKTIAMTGQGGGRLAALSDILLAVPSRSTPRIQEMHMLIYHYICGEVEANLYPTQYTELRDDQLGFSGTANRAGE